MRYGIVISTGTSREFAAAAVAAARAGWDFVFTFELVWGQDAWMTLAAAAMVTERIRLGARPGPGRSGHRRVGAGDPPAAAAAAKAVGCRRPGGDARRAVRRARPAGR